MSALCLYQEISPVRFTSATTRLVRSEAYSGTTKTRLRQSVSAKPNLSASRQESTPISTSTIWLGPSCVPRSSPASTGATPASPSLRTTRTSCSPPPPWATFSASTSEMERPYVLSRGTRGRSTILWRCLRWRSWSRRGRIATAACLTSGVSGPSDLIN